MKNYHYSKNKHCKCGKLIHNDAERCRSCAKKELYKDPTNHPTYIDGGTVEKHYCIESNCHNEISYSNWRVGQGRCQSCSNRNRKGKEHYNVGQNHPRFGKPSPQGKKTKYKNICMRSSYEIAFAQFLDLSGIKWKYESERFYFKNLTYLPDFYLPEFGIYIEIKGWWRHEDKKRFNLFKRNYSNKNIKVLMKPELEELGVL